LQVQAYQAYWAEKCDGKLGLQDFIDSAVSICKTSTYARDYAIKADKNQDGVISAAEFASLLELLKAHDPNLKDKSFEDFVAEADTNNDGQVDIDEMTEWIEKNSGKSEQWENL